MPFLGRYRLDIHSFNISTAASSPSDYPRDPSKAWRVYSALSQPLGNLSTGHCMRGYSVDSVIIRLTTDEEPLQVSCACWSDQYFPMDSSWNSLPEKGFRYLHVYRRRYKLLRRCWLVSRRVFCHRRSYTVFDGLIYRYKNILYSLAEYLDGQDCTNGVKGVCYEASTKHLGRYVGEFVFRLACRSLISA